MNISLAGRVALVTGASRGIGRAIAVALAGSGADVAVNYRREAAEAAATVAAIERLGRRAKAYQAAVDSVGDCERMVGEVLADFGAVGILVNNAGIASLGRAVADTDPAELERVLRVHAVAPHVLSRLVIPQMREQKRGDIIFISSIAVKLMLENGAPYAMAKAAVEALALTLAKEERRYGIRANVVGPGLTVTEMGRRVAKARMGVTDIHELDAEHPFGHVCTPEEVAAAVVYLVSDANPYASGQKLYIDGGG